MIPGNANPTMVRRLSGLLASAFLLAGCVQDATTDNAGSAVIPAPLGPDPIFEADEAPSGGGELAQRDGRVRPNLPADCLPGRPVLVHRAGGVAADSFPGPRPVACYHDTGYDSVEPTIGVLSDGTVFIGPGMVDWPDVFLTGGEIVEVGVIRTRDEGASWELVLPDIEGIAAHQATLDPYLYVDPMTDRVWLEDLTHAVNVALNSWSDDGGATWTHAYAGGVQTDHVTVFAGPPVMSPTIGYVNIVHRCGMGLVATNIASLGSLCQRSLTGGSSWLPPGEPAYVHGPGAAGVVGPVGAVDSCRGGNGHGFATDTGRIYLPRGHCGQPFLAWSDDEGLIWMRAQVSTLGVACDAATTDPELIVPTCADGPGVGIDNAGTLYYAWIAADHLPYMVTSRDGGKEWTVPIQIGVAGLTEASHLKLAAGAAGKIAFVYYGSQNSPGAPWNAGYEETTWNAYMAVSLNADAEHPIFASFQMNDPGDPMVRHVCGQLRCDGAGDFIDLRIAPDGTPWAPVVDACVDACVTDSSQLNNGSGVAAVRLWNVDLWGSEDPNGPYP